MNTYIVALGVATMFSMVIVLLMYNLRNCKNTNGNCCRVE
jgi:hypothetical protein